MGRAPILPRSPECSHAHIQCVAASRAISSAQPSDRDVERHGATRAIRARVSRTYWCIKPGWVQLIWNHPLFPSPEKHSGSLHFGRSLSVGDFDKLH